MTAAVIERLPIGVDDDRVTGWLVWRATGSQLHGLTGVGWLPLVPAEGHPQQVYPGVQVIVSRPVALSWLQTYAEEFDKPGVLVLGEVIAWGGQHVQKFRRGAFGYPLSFEAVVRGVDPFVLDDTHPVLGSLRHAYGVGKKSTVSIAHRNPSELVP